MVDPCSFANIDVVKQNHVHLIWEADFERKVLFGAVVINFEATGDLLEVILDSRTLQISAVHLIHRGQETSNLKFSIADEEAIGSKLTVQLPSTLAAGSQFQLKIHYETSPNAVGIQWLSPSQTDGKKHPYLFTQFQAIHARTAFPCQDSPAVKTTYSAEVTVPNPLVAVMSAISTENEKVSGADKTVFKFHQKVCIPTYLVALAIGKLESKEIGPRTKVWTEAETLERAAYEFGETEDYLLAAESILTPYVWGRYDLLCLPGSFPYGGMENPCLTFVTPTLLAGDRSLSAVVAHEIAHSWTGNLVTNATWEHFWLNEGFTVYVERKIIGRIFGEKDRQFEALLGWTSLKESVEHYGENHEFTKLQPKLERIDPDDAFSSIPYEKGFSFLYYLETRVGTDAFESFLRQWVINNSYKTATTDDFQQFFNSYFKGKVDDSVLESIDWNSWRFKPGMPPVNVKALLDDTLAKRSIDLASKWINGEPQASENDIQGWNTKQIVCFLEQILLDSPSGISKEKLDSIGSVYKFNHSRNSEIRMRWYSLCLASKYQKVFPDVTQFLSEQGRMKFVRPLYRALKNCGPEGKEEALKTFEQNKDNYHPIARKMIEQDLQK